MAEEARTRGHVLVIGAGPAGLRAALDLADLGVKVTVAERGPATGGVFTQLDVQYPTIDCGACQIHESLSGPPWSTRKCLRTGVDHPLITTLTSTSLVSVERSGTDFEVTLEQRQRWIDPEKCKACGTCASLCPIIVPDEHQAGQCERRATFRPHQLTDPPVYVIDETSCTRCGDCVPACPEGAIDLDRPLAEHTLTVDAVVIATGFTPFDPTLQPQWAYGRHPDVVTALELERMIRPRVEGGLHPPLRPSDGERADRVAFVQCVGSRDRDRPYCSAICCMHALKEAILLREQLGVSECHIYAIDMRCTGKGYEATLQRALASGVRVIHARPGAVETIDAAQRPVLRVETAPGRSGTSQSRELYDLVVLSTGLVPPKGAAELADLLGADLDAHGFFATLPGTVVESTQPGVFVCGAAAGPSDLPWSITTASQAALVAATHAGVDGTRRETPPPDQRGLPLGRPRRVPIATIDRTAPGVTEVEDLPVVPRALIVGAGPAGLAAARRIARTGIEVVLVDRADTAGGNLLDARRLMGGADPSQLLAQVLGEVGRLDAVRLLLGWELVKRWGGPGDATALLRNVKTQELSKVRHGAMILATGARELAPDGRFGFDDQRPGGGVVITQRQLEANLASSGFTPNGAPITVVMVQCVGSREPGRPVCSRVCCHEAIKNALWLKELAPRAWIIVLHRDVRAVGLDELWYERAREAGVLFIRVPDDEPPRVDVVEGDAGAVVRFRDPLLGRDVRVDADLVVLSTGLEPRLSPDEASRLGLRLDDGGFVVEANVKYRPEEASRAGVLVAGAAVAPMLVPEAMAQGEAAATRAIALLTRDRLVPRPGAAAYRPKWCAACGLCVEVCPAGARELDPERGAVIHVGLCQGCGGCAAACPSGCTTQPDLDEKGVMDAIEAAWEVVP